MRLRYLKRAGAAAIFGALLLVPQASLRAQRRGPAATGGSLALERAGERPPRAKTSAPESYKGVLRGLGLDYERLAAEHSESGRSAHPQNFRNIVLAHLLARDLSPSDEQGGVERVVSEMEAGRSLTVSVARVFDLSAAEARKHTRAAERAFERAARAAR
jgi:hypothetical protein